MNIQIGDSVSEDIKNSFLVTMDAQLEVFAKKIREVELMAMMSLNMLMADCNISFLCRTRVLPRVSMPLASHRYGVPLHCRR